MKLAITLKKSPIARLEKHKRTVKALGLRKVGQTVVQPDNACIRGMISVVQFMVDVEQVEE